MDQYHPPASYAFAGVHLDYPTEMANPARIEHSLHDQKIRIPVIDALRREGKIPQHCTRPRELISQARENLRARGEGTRGTDADGGIPKTPIINDLTLDDKQLDTYFNNQRAEKVGTIAYRIVMKWAKPGHFQMGSLDGATLPTGPGSKWQKGSVTPQVLMLPTGWTKLVELAGKKAPQVAITNVVDEVMNDVTEQLANTREVMLQTDGAGTLGILSSVDVGNQIVTCSSTPFGTRLLQSGLTVDCVNPATNLKRPGSFTIDYNFNFLGSAQTFGYIGGGVGTAQANDILRVQGVTDGAPVGIYGLAYFISTSTQGTTLGINRGNSPYMVSNGYNNGGNQITLPIFRLVMNQVKQRIGKRGLKGQFFHTHPSQVASYEELGFQLQMIPMADGKAKGLDLLFAGEKSIDGFPIIENVRADQTVWDFIQPKAFGHVKFGDGPFWYDTGIGKIYPIIDGFSWNAENARITGADECARTI